MQPISDLPKDLFENVTYHTLRNQAGKFNIRTEDHFLFGYEDKFRGVKKSFSEGQPPFYLSHSETFETTCKTFCGLFGVEPDLLTEFHDEAKTWNAFIVSHSNMVSYEPEYSAQPVLGRLSQFADAQANSFVNFPLIGGFNSYGFDKNPAFFYLVGTPFRALSGSLLTLDNFRFTKDDEKLPFIVGNRSEALARLIDTLVKRFGNARSAFDKLLAQMATQQVLETDFAPVVLDLYNRNRNPQSIQNDDRLRQRVRRLYIDAADSVKKRNTVPWTEFIRFIVRYNQFFFHKEILLESIEELFSRKESYQKFDVLFRRFLNDPGAFIHYVDGQVSDWERIKDTVLDTPGVTGFRPG